MNTVLKMDIAAYFRCFVEINLPDVQIITVLKENNLKCDFLTKHGEQEDQGDQRKNKTHIYKGGQNRRKIFFSYCLFRDEYRVVRE